ncbi:MAG: hypothetical protein R3331_08915 [Sulfurospirillaceae bacterium]|nr:hypothetical protein [Sulfurospirillaceae bacterium]
MKIIPVIVSTVLLVAAIILSFTVSINGEKMLTKKNTIVLEYVNKSDLALKAGDINSALKYAKLAISADPSNDKGFTSYNNAIEAKYKPADTTKATDTTPPPAAPAPEAPSDQGSSMGC